MILIDTAATAWLKSIEQVMEEGETRFPRQIETRESLNVPVFFDMNYPICFHLARDLSYKFMAAEAYWITSGSPLVEDIEPYNSHIAQYSDDGYIFNGAYGPAFLSQLNFVVQTLLKDPHSRQAVMTIWHPNPIDTKDHKCTIALAFCIRDGKMHTTVFMRSNDLFLGRPYDMFNFTIMTLRVLTMLNSQYTGPAYELGTMCLHAVSSHIYAKDFENIKDMLVVGLCDEPNNKVPTRCLKDWIYVIESLLACRDMLDPDEYGLWRIRPCD